MGTNFPNGISSRGVDVLGAGNEVFLNGTGNVYYVDAKNGSADNDGKTPQTAKKALADAYNLTVADQNDVVILLATDSSTQISSTLTWAKDFVHLIGA